jgi:hypothetical protein
MLVGTAVGLVAGIASTLLVTATIRPDVVIALVVGVPSAIGLLRVRAGSVTLTVFGICSERAAPPPPAEGGKQQIVLAVWRPIFRISARVRADFTASVAARS